MAKSSNLSCFLNANDIIEDNLTGVASFEADLASQRVVVVSTLPSGDLTRALQSTGLNVIIRGHGWYPP